jgi:hypothetical protein
MWNPARSKSKTVSRFRIDVLTATIFAIAIGVAAHRAQAQIVAPTHTVADSLPAPVYERYGSPDACLAATRRIRNTLSWDGEPDTLPDRASRAIPPAVAAAARRCGARFVVDSVLEKSLDALQQLALLANDDAWAARVARRRIALVAHRPARARNMVLETILIEYLNASPIHFTQADTLFHLMDSTDANAQTPRFWAQQATFGAATRSNDAARARSAVAVWMHLLHQTPRAQRQGWQATMTGGMLAFTTLLGPAFPADSAFARYRDTIVALFGPDKANLVVGMIGHQAPRVSGNYTFGQSALTSGDHAMPKASLVVFLDERCGASCTSRYAVLRRLATRFGASLQMTVVTRTNGFLRNVLLVHPDSEADAIHHYLTGFFHLPGALVVETTPFQRNAAPDRRRVNGQTSLATQYPAPPELGGMVAFVIDRNQRVVWPAITVAREQEPLLETVLERLTAAP